MGEGGGILPPPPTRAVASSDDYIRTVNGRVDDTLLVVSNDMSLCLSTAAAGRPTGHPGTLLRVSARCPVLLVHVGCSPYLLKWPCFPPSLKTSTTSNLSSIKYLQ